MANQILKTRINLKIDTLTNWNDSTLILGKGEVAIATASSSAGAGLTEPVCMIKIGDGDHKFSELGWDFYAKSSDVLTACKTEKGLTEFIDGVIAKSGIASDDAMKALAAKVEAVETDIQTINGDSDTTGSIANAIKTAIEALDLANTYATKTEVSEAQSAAEATAANALATARTEISAEIDADVAALETALDARLDVLEGINHETFATKSEMEAETEVREAAEAQILADAQAYADEIKADLLGESDTLEGTYDTLREIAGWISTHEGETVTNLTQAIADEEAARKAADDALAERIKAYEDVKSTYAIKSEVEAAQSAASEDATAKANAAEAAAKAHAVSVATTAKSEAISTAAADATSKADASEAAAKAYADGLAGNYATKAQGETADTALQTIAAGTGLTVSEKGNGTTQTISFDTECVFIFDCGDSKTNIY